MKELSTLLREAGIYEANKQWDNAALLYSKILDRLYEGNGPSAQLSNPGWAEVVAALKKFPEKRQGRILPLGKMPASLHALGLKISKALTPFDFKKIKYFSVFREEFIKRWTLVLLEEKSTVKYGHIRLDAPEGNSYAFVLDYSPLQQTGAVPAVEGYTVRQPQADLLAYCWAHLGNSRVVSATNLYVFSKVLILTGFPLIMHQFRYLHYALLLKPAYGWVWAHMGEAYRNMANGWWPTVNEMLEPQKRIDCYIKALVYLHKAMELQPGDFWCKAHLGATICNVRSFVPDNACQIPALKALIEAWFGAPKKGGGGNHQTELQFTDYAIQNLVEAQTLAGEYYPWAQAYQAVAMYIKAFLVQPRDKDAALNLTQNALAFSVDSYILWPQLITDSIEPGQIYNNPFISLSLFALYLQDYNKAWSYALLTLSRSFDNPFIPGLSAVIVFQVLISTSYNAIVNPKQGQGPSLPQVPIGIFENFPTEPIRDPAQLAEFIEQTFRYVIVPTVEPFLPKSIHYDTKITMGLMAVVFLLFDAIATFEFAAAGDPGSEAVSSELKAYLHCLCARLGIVDPYPELRFGNQWTPELKKGFMFSLVNFRNLSYAALNILQEA